MVLASLGLYGVLSYMARQRTREVGVRLARGANQRHVMRLIPGQEMVLSLIGIGLGLVASFAVTRVVSGYLVGISSTDPATMALVPAVLLAVAPRSR